MSDQPPVSGPPPQVLMPASGPPPPRRRWGLRLLLALLIPCAVLVAIGAALLYSLGDLFTIGGEERVYEVHYGGDWEATDKVAIVTLDEAIYEGSARRVIKQIRKAAQDQEVKAVVFKVDSPGGTVTASDHIYREVKKLCRDGDKPKPLVVSMQSLAASGGYYVSVPANRIFAEPTTLTGSIGVIAAFPNVSGLMKDWKIDYEVIKSGPMKDSGSPFRPMTERDRRRWQQLIDSFFERFLGIVAEGRKMEMKQVKELATGEVFTASEAKRKKLIDEIGYLDDAIEAAKRLAGVSRAHVIEYKRPATLSDLLLGEVSGRAPGPPLNLENLLRLQVPRLLYLAPHPAVGL